MLSCPSCAHENPDGQKFCGECGSRLEPVAVIQERKVITALFCDLVGSTALGERLDAEDIARLLHRYQGVCRRRIESHGALQGRVRAVATIADTRSPEPGVADGLDHRFMFAPKNGRIDNTRFVDPTIGEGS